MSGCVKNILTKNYQNLIIGFKLQPKMSGMFIFETQCGSVQFGSIQFNSCFLLI